VKQFIMILALGIPLLGAPKTKVYPASCDRVWAAVKVAATPPHYNFAMLDDGQKKGIVSTGSGMTGKRNLDLTLTGTGESCTVAIGGSFSGLAHDDKGDLFKRIEAGFAQTGQNVQGPEAKK
jgi:subtilisin family serine protease